MSRDEIAVLDGNKCVLQLRGVRPFLSDKYDLTQHPNYKYTADFDKKYILFQHFTMEPGAFENMIIKDDWCAIRYTVKIKNLDTGKEILQNTMEFVKFKENPDPIGVRVVEGWALSDITLGT